MTSLKQHYQSHTGKLSIKWAHYISIYDRIFSKIKDQPVRILEIGIQNGGSLEILSKYFEKGEKFIGCDINQKCSELKYQDKRISVVVGDINDEAVRDEIINISNFFSIIIDDGSHLSSDIIKSFFTYFYFLDNGGTYIIEDMHASYWQEYQGGLYFPFSAMSFFKLVVDVINSEAWKNSKSVDKHLEKIFRHLSISSDVNLLASVHSVEFVNSMCIIKKDFPENNELGGLLVVGEHEIITSGYKNSDFNITFPDQSDNPWSNSYDASDEFFESNAKKIKGMEASLSNFEQYVDQLNRDVLNLKSSINAIQNTFSWRLTKPLRYLKKLVYK